jgi:ATP phosphoribosyltransferase
MSRRMTLAVPNKGRLVEPTLTLLHDAGLRFEERERSLVSPVENVPLDILFVRTGDVVEFVRDRVADLGITGADLLAESGADLRVVRHLGYGRCRLAAAVPQGARQRKIDDLAGLRVATAHPTSTRSYFAGRGMAVEVISLSGAVEVAPRLGLADAIVDLVSSGATLVENGLREVGQILASEAILVCREQPPEDVNGLVERLDTMLGAVLAARRRKYLLMNAPAERRAVLEGLLPGLESPSIVPLAHEGMIAIHAVVEADEIWDLLPKLKAAGASGILVLPIEKLVA